VQAHKTCADYICFVVSFLLFLIFARTIFSSKGKNILLGSALSEQGGEAILCLTARTARQVDKK
jgi:hypothetical protein